MKCCRCQVNKEQSEFDGKKSCRLCRTKRAEYAKKWIKQINDQSFLDKQRCSRCKVVKALSEFVDDDSKCIRCQEYVRCYYKKNKDQEIRRAMKSQKAKGREKINEYKRQLNRKNPINYILQGAKQRAKKLGLPFNLTREDIVIPEYCPVFGFKLQVSDKASCPESISIDRLIPEKGYVKGNIQIISWRANDIKGNATPEELRKVADYIEGCLKNSLS